DLWPVRGQEQGLRRPVLVVANDQSSHGPAGVIVVVPLTTRDRRVPLHVGIDPPEGGLRERSYAMCDQVRTISKTRLDRRWGTVSPSTIQTVEDRLRILMDL